MGAAVVAYVVGWHWLSEVTVVIANYTRVPSSHNILLYEDGHAVVADFGGKRHFAVFYLLYKKIKAAFTIFYDIESNVQWPRQFNTLQLEKTHKQIEENRKNSANTENTAQILQRVIVFSCIFSLCRTLSGPPYN